MTRGFLIGAFWGLLVGGLVVVIASVILETRDIRPLVPGPDPVGADFTAGYGDPALATGPRIRRPNIRRDISGRSLRPRPVKPALPPISATASPRDLLAPSDARISFSTETAPVLAPRPEPAVARPFAMPARRQILERSARPLAPGPPRRVSPPAAPLRSGLSGQPGPENPEISAFPSMPLNGILGSQPRKPGANVARGAVAVLAPLEDEDRTPPRRADSPKPSAPPADRASQWTRPPPPVTDTAVALTLRPRAHPGASDPPRAPGVSALGSDVIAMAGDVPSRDTGPRIAFVLVLDDDEEPVVGPDWARTVAVPLGRSAPLDDTETFLHFPDRLSASDFVELGTYLYGAERATAVLLDGAYPGGALAALLRGTQSGLVVADKAFARSTLKARDDGIAVGLAYIVIDGQTGAETLERLALRAERDGEAIALVRPSGIPAVEAWLQTKGAASIRPVMASDLLR